MIVQPVSMLELTIIEKEETLKELRDAGIDLTEASLLKYLKTEHRPSVSAIIALSFISATGSPESIDTLKNLVRTRKGDLQIVALLSLARIAGSSENSYYVALMSERWFRHKVYLMSILWEVGNGEGLHEVRVLAQEIISDDLKKDDWSNDMPYLIEYLRKYSNTPKDKKIIEQLEKIYRKLSWGYNDYIRHFLRRKKDV